MLLRVNIESYRLELKKWLPRLDVRLDIQKAVAADFDFTLQVQLLRIWLS